VKVVDREYSPYFEELDQEFEELESEKARYESAVKYAKKHQNHLKRCSLYWKEFL
jgi:hypothetical protein